MTDFHQHNLLVLLPKNNSKCRWTFHYMYELFKEDTETKAAEHQ